MATEPRSAADTFVGTFLRWLSELQVVAGPRTMLFVEYLTLPAAQREGDERPIVDGRFTRGLLELLGYRDQEIVYDEARRDFRVVATNGGAPVVDCFVVEDKNTTVERLVDHIPQVSRYAREAAVNLGVLCNGRRILVYWYGEGFDVPALVVSANIERLAAKIRGAGQQQLPLKELEREDELALKSLYIRLTRENFADIQAHIQRISLHEDQWRAQARNVSESHNEREFIQRLTMLIMDVQADAEHHLRLLRAAYDAYLQERNTIQYIPAPGAVPEQIGDVQDELNRLRRQVMDKVRQALGDNAEPVVGEVDDALVEFERDPSVVGSADALQARVRKALPTRRKAILGVADLAKRYYDIVVLAARHRAELDLRYQNAIDAIRKFRSWQQILRGTFFFGDEDQAIREFTLQTAYVYIVRALLVRVCEDKGLFHRGLSDDGFGQLRDTLQRFAKFTALRYHEMLNVVYRNAEGLYAHFYAGRRLFDWYEMDEARFVRVLYDLNLFDFSTVGRDIIGTVYEKYADAHERQEKGRFFTSPVVTSYILDAVEYTPEGGIAGARVLDPACGSGTFLVQAVQRLVEAYRRSPVSLRAGEILELVVNAVYGLDINPFACYLAETNLLIQVLDLVRDAIADGSYHPIDRFHIYNTDSLRLPAEAGQLPLLLEAEEMAREQRVIQAIKGRQRVDDMLDFAQGFDFVVGNPPYGVVGGLGAFEAAQGNNNLYPAFMELAGRLCRVPGGRIGMIVQSSWLAGPEYLSARSYIFRLGRLDMAVKLPYDVFPDAYVDTVIFTLCRDSEYNPAAGFATGTARTYEFPARGGLTRLNHATLQYVGIPLDRWHRQPGLEIILNPVALDLRDHVQGLATVPLGDLAGSARGVLLGQEVQPVNTRRSYRDLPFFTGDVWRYGLDIRTAWVRYDDRLPERPGSLRFFKGSRTLVRRLISRQYRAMAAVTPEPFVTTKDLYMLLPTHANVTPEYFAAIVNSQLGAVWLVGASTIAQKDDFPQLTLDGLRQLPIVVPDERARVAIDDRVGSLQELNGRLALRWAAGHRIETRDSVHDMASIRDMRAVTIRLAASAFIPAGPKETLLDAVTNGRLHTLGSVDAVVSRVDIAPRNGSWHVVFRGSPERPQAGLVCPDEKTATIVAALVEERRAQSGSSTVRQVLEQVRIARDAASMRAWVQAMHEEEERIRELIREIWRLDDELDQMVFELYQVPTTLRDAVHQIVSGRDHSAP